MSEQVDCRGGPIRRQAAQTAGGTLKQILIVVKPFRAEAVLACLSEGAVGACVVSEAKGFGRQKSYLERYQGSEYATAFVPKVEITAWVEDADAEQVLLRVVEQARTGRIGDGKIFVLPVCPERIISF
jgi:nitrogen regulatory protein P-II 2